MKIHKFEYYFQKGILRKVFIILLLVSLIPLFILLIANRLSVSEQSIEHSADSYGKICIQTAEYLSDKTSTVKSIMDMLASDSVIQDFSILDDVSSGITKGNWVYYEYGSNEIIFKSYLNEYITHIFLYLEESVIKKYNTGIKSSLIESSLYKYEKWYQGDENYIWVTPTDLNNEHYSDRYVYFISKIPSEKYLNKNIGLMQADVPVSILESILSSAVVTENTRILLLDENNNIIVAGSELILDKESIEIATGYLLVSETTDTLFRISLQDENYLAGMQYVTNTDWRILFLVPYSDILAITRSTNRLIILLIILIIIILIPSFFFIARSMTSRLRKLNNSIIAAMDGDYSIHVDPGAEDEVGQISQNFNVMLEQTVALIDEKYKMGQSLKNAEMQILQEQINPHFLYNTLEMLHWMAIKSDADDIDKVVKRLSQFYKLSLSSGDEMITVEHELMQVEAYVDIQNIRFNNKIKMIIDVPQEIRECSIVKIVFQPLVENSIQHGLREQMTGEGHVVIKGLLDEDEIVFSVEDDGIGMEEDEVASIINEKRSKGYGIHNINERLTLHYGERSKLFYESKIGKGTKVTLRIPKTKYKS